MLAFLFSKASYFQKAFATPGIAAIGLLQSIDETLHSRKLRSFDEPPFR